MTTPFFSVETHTLLTSPNNSSRSDHGFDSEPYLVIDSPVGLEVGYETCLRVSVFFYVSMHRLTSIW